MKKRAKERGRPKDSLFEIRSSPCASHSVLAHCRQVHNESRPASLQQYRDKGSERAKERERKREFQRTSEIENFAKKSVPPYTNHHRHILLTSACFAERAASIIHLSVCTVNRFDAVCFFGACGRRMVVAPLGVPRRFKLSRSAPYSFLSFPRRVVHSVHLFMTLPPSCGI